MKDSGAQEPNGEDDLLLLHLARTLLAQGSPGEALFHLRLVSGGDHEGEVKFLMGVAHLRTGDVAMAIEELLAAHRALPDDPRVATALEAAFLGVPAEAPGGLADSSQTLSTPSAFAPEGPAQLSPPEAGAPEHPSVAVTSRPSAGSPSARALRQRRLAPLIVAVGAAARGAAVRMAALVTAFSRRVEHARVHLRTLGEAQRALPPTVRPAVRRVALAALVLLVPLALLRLVGLTGCLPASLPHFLTGPRISICEPRPRSGPGVGQAARAKRERSTEPRPDAEPSQGAAPAQRGLDIVLRVFGVRPAGVPPGRADSLAAVQFLEGLLPTNGQQVRAAEEKPPTLVVQGRRRRQRDGTAEAVQRSSMPRHRGFTADRRALFDDPLAFDQQRHLEVLEERFDERAGGPTGEPEATASETAVEALLMDPAATRGETRRP